MRIKVFVLINMLILAGCLIAGAVIHRRAGQLFAQDVLFAAPKLNESHLFFSNIDVQRMRFNFPTYTIAAEGRGRIMLSTSTMQANSAVFYVDNTYFEIQHVDFAEGRELLSSNEIILNETLAWSLFGSNNITGLMVQVGNNAYTVVGVVRQNMGNTAWIKNDGSHPVTALYIRAENYNYVDAAVDMRNMLMGFRNPDEYTIVDINLYVRNIATRIQILLLMVLMYVSILLIFTARRHRVIFAVLGAAVFLYVIFGINDILRLLPNFSDDGFSLLNWIGNIGQLPPEGYLSYGLLQLNRLNNLANNLWVTGAVGFVNIMFCLRMVYDEKICR